MCDWIVQELGSVDFGDERLRSRFLSMAAAVHERPSSSLPEAIGDWASLKAVYRFFDNERVSCENILQPHIDETVERIKRHKIPILLIQDTTYFNYTTHWKTQL